MRFSLRIAFLTIFCIAFILFSACDKDEESTIVQSGLAIEDFEIEALNAYPIMGFMQTSSPTNPLLDGNGKDLIWHETQAYEVETNATDGAGPTVSLKALYDNYYLFILAEWEDDSPSRQKDVWWFGEPGQNDTTYVEELNYSWNRISEPWEGVVGQIDKIKIDTTTTPWDSTFIYEYEKVEFSGNEDGLALMFNVNSTNFLNCTNYCHGTTMKTDANETVDMWHWHAGLTGPRNYVDDKYLDSEGFQDDSGTPIFKENLKDDNPNFATAQDPGANAMALYDSTAVQYYETLSWFGGNSIPGWVVQRPSGSKSDIVSYARHSEGKWTLEIKRALNTLIEDGTDIILDPGTNASLEFHVAVYDNNSGKDHAISNNVHLIRFLQYNQ
jgi:hypothetical protein